MVFSWPTFSFMHMLLFGKFFCTIVSIQLYLYIFLSYHFRVWIVSVLEALVVLQPMAYISTYGLTFMVAFGFLGTLTLLLIWELCQGPCEPPKLRAAWRRIISKLNFFKEIEENTSATDDKMGKGIETLGIRFPQDSRLPFYSYLQLVLATLPNYE